MLFWKDQDLSEKGQGNSQELSVGKRNPAEVDSGDGDPPNPLNGAGASPAFMRTSPLPRPLHRTPGLLWGVFALPGGESVQTCTYRTLAFLRRLASETCAAARNAECPGGRAGDPQDALRGPQAQVQLRRLGRCEAALAARASRRSARRARQSGPRQRLALEGSSAPLGGQARSHPHGAAG